MIHPLIARAATFDVAKRPPDPVITFYSGVATISGGNYPPGVFAALVPTHDTLRSAQIGNFRAVVDFNQGLVNFNWEQLPHSSNRIRLDPSKDSLFGDSRVNVTFGLGQTDWDTLTKGLKLVGAELEALGYAKNFKQTDDPVWLPGAHAMGTTRIATYREAGVVNPDCRVHVIDNVYVASSAVFPTGGFANPTLTIIVLALRLATHLGA